MDDFIQDIIVPAIHGIDTVEIDRSFGMIQTEEDVQIVISQSVDAFFQLHITFPYHIIVFRHFIREYGYVPTLDNIFHLLESTKREMGLQKILRLLLKHSESGFNRLYPRSIDFIDFLYDRDLWGEMEYGIPIVNILIRDYISRKNPEDKVELDQLLKLVIDTHSKLLLRTILQAIFEFELKEHNIHSDTMMEIFEFVIHNGDKSLLNEVYYLFVEYLGMVVSEEQLSHLFELAGKSNNIDILEYLQERRTTSPSQRKRMLDTAFVSAVENTKQKRQRHSPVVKYLLEQPEMNVIPHQAYQASLESPYDNLSDMFYEHNELLYRPGTGKEYKIALDRFNVNLPKL